jgi:lipopolysaccharide export system permease protein
MRILHNYLTRQVLLTLGMTVSVFTFLLLLTNLLKEILSLLVSHQATVPAMMEAIALLIPFVMAFALPMGMLTAALLVFGRFSADQELTAARASGLSLLSLITPVLLLSVALSVLCGWFNLDIAPRCRVAYKELLLRLGYQNTTSFIPEGRFVDLKGWGVVYARRRDGDHLEDVHLYKMENDRINQIIAAKGGVVVMDSSAGKIHMMLTNAITFFRIARDPGPTEPDSLDKPEAKHPQEWQGSSLEVYQDDIDLPKVPQQLEKPKLTDMSYRQLRQEIRERERQGIDTTPAQVQLHRQVAFSFASLGFTLIGIPLGIRAHRRETTAGIALALVLVLVYYSFIVLAQSWETRPDLFPQLVVWIPNFLFQAIGGILLWKANRGL